jgi:hypothetical protein
MSRNAVLMAEHIQTNGIHPIHQPPVYHSFKFTGRGKQLELPPGETAPGDVHPAPDCVPGLRLAD